MEERSSNQCCSQAATLVKPSLALANPNEIHAVGLHPGPHQLVCLRPMSPPARFLIPHVGGSVHTTSFGMISHTRLRKTRHRGWECSKHHSGRSFPPTPPKNPPHLQPHGSLPFLPPEANQSFHVSGGCKTPISARTPSLQGCRPCVPELKAPLRGGG